MTEFFEALAHEVGGWFRLVFFTFCTLLLVGLLVAATAVDPAEITYPDYDCRPGQTATTEECP